MNARRIVLGLAIIMLLAGNVVFWIRRTGPHFSSESISSKGSADDARTRGSLLKSASSSLSASVLLDPRQQLKRVFEILNHNPIEFYGRALDQFGVPVAAADVQGSILYNTGVKSGITSVQTITDAEGKFQFTGLMGQDLGIGIRKEGYDYYRRNSSFSFSYFEADRKRHQPDRNRPVVFVLWRKQGAEPLIHYDRVWRFPLSVSPVKINLQSGEIDETDADIVVSVSRSPLRMRYGQRGFAWNAAVNVVDGGLIRAGALDYYNLAPEFGYQPRFEHVQEAQDLYAAQIGRTKWTWEEAAADDFFISSRQGKNFSHVALRIRSNSDRKEGDNEALIEAEVWLNPNGSRNLEFDPAKVIPVP